MQNSVCVRRPVASPSEKPCGQAPTTTDVLYSEGNYQAYIEDLRRRKGADADQPHRIAYLRRSSIESLFDAPRRYDAELRPERDSASGHCASSAAVLGARSGRISNSPARRARSAGTSTS